MPGRLCWELISVSPREHCPVNADVFCAEDGHWRCPDHANEYWGILERLRAERRAVQQENA